MIKPILMNTKMVRAILDGRKTVTRRPVNYKHLRGLENLTAKKIQRACIAPYQIGDILWVRETWSTKRSNDCLAQPCNTGTCPYESCETAEGPCFPDEYIYKATDSLPPYGRRKWRPSIHMPREAARIWLRVTAVRVERLQEIDEDGIRAEGLTSACVHAGDMEIAAQEFALLWDSTIKPADRDRYGWAANPWVWMIEFERYEKPAD